MSPPTGAKPNGKKEKDGAKPEVVLTKRVSKPPVRLQLGWKTPIKSEKAVLAQQRRESAARREQDRRAIPGRYTDDQMLELIYRHSRYVSQKKGVALSFFVWVARLENGYSTIREVLEKY